MTFGAGFAHHPRMGDRPRQFDLFGDRPPALPDARPASPAPRLATLSDDDILDRLPDATMRDARQLCDLVVRRGMENRALSALDRLWHRFRGFGRASALPEQQAVVETLARIDTEEARIRLAGIVTAADLPPPLLTDALRAALTAGLQLPRTFTGPLLRHADPLVRELAARLSRFGAPDIAALEESIGDTHAPVRRAAAVALGWFGRTSAKTVLLQELYRDPAREIVTALTGIADDDIAVHLGRCAEAHPALAETVAAGLEDMETELSLKVARRIRAMRARRLN